MISYYTFQSGTSGGGARGEGVGSGDLDVVESLPPIREGGALGEGVVGAGGSEKGVGWGREGVVCVLWRTTARVDIGR